MPIYEYECKSCGQVTEAFQKFSDAPLKVCPHCKKRGLRKLISQTSFQLKGSGWYVTDYARADQGGAKGQKASQGPEKAEKAEKAEKKEKKAEAPKAEAKK